MVLATMTTTWSSLLLFLSWLLVSLLSLILLIVLLPILFDLVVDVLKLVRSFDSFIGCGWWDYPGSISHEDGVQPF